MPLSTNWVILTFGIVILLIALRIHIAVSLMLVGFVRLIVIQGYDVAIGILKSIPFEFAASWSLSTLPMYLLMGYIAFHSGMAEEIFNAVRVWLYKLPGALSITTVFASAGFGAICGSSGATAATFAKISVPEMLKDGYDIELATGSVAGAGTLGSLMPPSVLMIIYAVIVEESIGRCFMAGVLPAILSAIMLSLMVYTRCKLNPKLAPQRVVQRPTRKQRVTVLFQAWDVMVLIIIVFGGIYSGIFTATEAAALGAFAAVVIGWLRHRLPWENLKEALFETGRVTAMVLIIGVGANIYVRLLALMGLHEWVVVQTAGMSASALLLGLFVLYFVLGMFLDPIGIILLTIPILDPIMVNLGINKVWFCILLIKNMEIALLTPPVGLNVYVVKGVMGPDVKLETVFKGIAWFVVVDLITLMILFRFPQISLFLPNAMFGK